MALGVLQRRRRGLGSFPFERLGGDNPSNLSSRFVSVAPKTMAKRFAFDVRSAQRVAMLPRVMQLDVGRSAVVSLPEWLRGWT